MKIATWNVNSVRARLKHVLKWLDSTQIDVLCLQETKCVDEKFPIGPLRLAGYSAEFVGEKSYNGVAILSKHPISNVQKSLPDDDQDPKSDLLLPMAEAFGSSIRMYPRERNRAARNSILSSNG